MAGKKNRPHVWRLAGEPVVPVTFTPAEEQMFLSRFSKLPKKFAIESDSPIGVSQAVARARENAARLSASFFLENCKGSREAVLDALVSAVSMPVRFLEWFGEPDFLMMGAACWFLDYAEERGLKKQVFDLLPMASDMDDMDLPLAEDMGWPRELLVRMVVLLKDRRGSREFRRLLKLIKKEDAAALRTIFRDAVLDFFQRYYEIQTRVKPAVRQDAEAAFPLAPLPSASSFFNKSREKPSLPGMKSIAEETPGIHFLLRAPELLGAAPDRVQSVLYFRRMTEKLTGFHTPDPYSICAAGVLLEQENDLLWSLNTLADIVVLSAQRSLPWTLQEAVWQKPLSVGAETDQTPRFLFHPPEEDEIAPLGDEIKEGELLSEAQLFYLATGYLLPRTRGPSEGIAAWFEKQGVPAERARELSLYALMVSRINGRDDWEENFEWPDTEDEAREGTEEGRTIGEESTEEADEEDRQDRQERTAASEKDNSDARIAELSRQLKEAKKELYDSDRTVRQLKEQLSAEQQAAAQVRAELSSLRDALFRMKTPDQGEEQPRENSIEFPWTGRRRILVFGGHDTWSKVIRPLLPGVRFCDRELLPDLNAIKSADIVWIQPNALSHKFYYRIIETARKENIPVRYFGFASARKCAEQLVEAELAAEEG